MAQAPTSRVRRYQPPPGERLPAADTATMERAGAFLAADRDLPPTETRMRYVLLSQPRTGGTLLSEALQRCGHAGLPFEYLNPAAIKLIARRLGMGNRIALQQMMAAVQRRRTTPNGVFGLHLHLDQITGMMQTAQRAAAWLRRFDRIVFLYRRDKLAQAVSLERSLQSRVWYRETHEAGERDPAAWNVDPWAVFRHVANFGQQEALIRDMLSGFSAPQMELTYEELDADFAAAWGRVSDFLGLPPVPAGTVYPALARMRDPASERMMERVVAALRDSDLMSNPAFRSIPAARSRG
jgi:LPS sulfotransferase NodH